MSCIECLHAHISSHSLTPSHMPMPSVTTITGSTNDIHIPSPYRLTLTQCKCQWATNPNSISTPITQLEVYMITVIVCLLWETELFGLRCGSFTLIQNFSDHTVGLLHPCSRLFTLGGVKGLFLAPPNTHYLYFFLCFKP